MNQGRVHELFSKVAARMGEAVAADYGDRRIQYRELEERSNNLANFLIASGASKGSIVAILAEDGIEVIIAIVAILKAGCVFVPLDPDLPERRLAEMMAEAPAKWFVVESRFFGRIPLTPGANVICVDSITAPEGGRSDLRCLGEYAGYRNIENPALDSHPDDMCYIYFTSGSTGRPKGIAGRLMSIDHFVKWEIETFGVGEGTRVSQLTSPSFDAYLRDVFVPLCAGGTVCGLKGIRTSLDAECLIDWVERQRVNLIHCVPSLFRLMLSAGLKPNYFSALKNVLLAGEPVLPSDVRRWTGVFEDRIQLVNMYGPSETTMIKLFYPIRPSDRDRRSIPIGKPMPGARAIVIDADGNICPPGAVGEICIRTPYRSLGYYNRPELTSEVFIQNPYTGAPDDLIYKTGDLGRVLEDGNFEFLRRKDRQVKIRGVRVELREIENLLLEHETVKEAAVVDLDDESGNKYLCAYVVFVGEVGISALRNYLASRLPHYLVPSMFAPIASLPRTITGKVDRRALPSIEQARAAAGGISVGPRTPIEEALAAIWSEALNLENIGVEENFFEIGGHSLMATQVISRVEAVFETELPLRALFEFPTIRGLAKEVESGLLEGRKLKAPPITRVERIGKLPLSYAQRRLWFIDQLEPGNSAYNISGGVALEGRLNFQVLEQAINEVVRRHEVLRTRFEVEEGEPVQIIDEWEPRRLERTDLTGVHREEKETEVQRLMREVARTRFDLSRGPLLRIIVIELEEEEHVLLYAMHHIVSDVWSMGVLSREISTLYRAISEGKDSPLPELKIQYVDYACWQRSYLNGETLERHLQYWRNQLSGNLPVINLPADHPRPLVPSYRGATNLNLLPAGLSQSLRRLSGQEGVTLFMLLLAAFKTMLYRYTAQEDIIVGVSWLNRDRAETELLIGFFVNMLPMRTDLSGNPRFRELLTRVKGVALDAYTHQEAPFEKLVEEIQPERKVGRTPLYNVVFGLHKGRKEEGAGESQPNGINISSLGVERESAKVDLMLWITEEQEAMWASWVYSANLFEEETIIRMHGHFETLLFSIAARPDAPIDELEILTESERSRQAINQAARREFNYSRFKSVKPRAIPLSEG
jgi:amino acid adenylation domain-containing protein